MDGGGRGLGRRGIGGFVKGRWGVVMGEGEGVRGGGWTEMMFLLTFGAFEVLLLDLCYTAAHYALVLSTSTP